MEAMDRCYAKQMNIDYDDMGNSSVILNTSAFNIINKKQKQPQFHKLKNHYWVTNFKTSKWLYSINNNMDVLVIAKKALSENGKLS